MQTCPNCGFISEPTDTECPKCGIVYDKWEATEARKKALESEQKKQAEDKAKGIIEERAKRIAKEEALKTAKQESKRLAEEKAKRAVDLERKRQEWEAKKAITAKKLPTSPYEGGTEGKLQGVGTYFLVMGIIGGVACFICATQVTSVFIGLCIGFGIGAFIQGFISYYLFRGGADIIRLLKKLNGLPYGGDIAGIRSLSTRYECAECGYILPDSEAKFCEQCGRLFRN